MNELTRSLHEYIYLALIMALAVGWLLRHRGVGANMLPQLGAQPLPAKKLEQQAMTAGPRLNLTASDIRNIVQAEMSCAKAPHSTGSSAMDAAHRVVDLIGEHPDQQAALAPVITALAAKAATKPA